MTTPPLTQILTDLINGRIEGNHYELSGHLHFRFRPASVETPEHRLCCYRYGPYRPSDSELATVRRHLETIQAIAPTLGDSFDHTDAYGRVRRCRVFAWPPANPPQQAILPIDLPDDAWRQQYGD
ncbi:MAG: hypothetical protein KF770_17625 [Anaerolineae bacterium]|nr:hypothetical protein [Anaerolineae bacterium]